MSIKDLVLATCFAALAASGVTFAQADPPSDGLSTGPAFDGGSAAVMKKGLYNDSETYIGISFSQQQDGLTQSAQLDEGTTDNFSSGSGVTGRNNDASLRINIPSTLN